MSGEGARVRARFRRLPAVATVAVLVGLGLPLAHPQRAAAAEPDALASITLTSITPSLPKRDGTITLEGTVTNTSKDPIVRPQALLWRDQSPITDADGLDQALASDADSPIGRRLVEPGAYQPLWTADRPDLDPGKSVTFTVTAKVADLELAPTDGVYLVGVHVTQNGVPLAVGRARVLVPVLSKPPTNTLSAVTLVELDSRPSLLGPGILSDDHLAREVAPGGRLRALLDAAARDDASYAVDPALVAELQTMRAGYQVRVADGQPTTGRGQADATRWLSDLARLRGSHDGYRLLFGSPDVAALAHSGKTDVLRSAAAAGRRVEATEDLPLLVLPTGGNADAVTLAAASALDPRAVLLSDTATRGAGPLLVDTSATGDRTTVVTTTSAALDGGPGPDPSDDAVHIQQRTLATSWVEASSSTGAAGPAGTTQVHLIRTRAQATSTTSDPPWTKAIPLEDLLSERPARWDGDLRYPGSAADDELTPAQLRRLDRLDDAGRSWADLLVEGDDADAVADAGVARAASGSWRGRAAASSAYVAPQLAGLEARLEDPVSISSSPRVSTVALEGVKFPITVHNNLAPVGDGGGEDPNAVRVRLVFVSDNPQRLAITPISADIAPGSSHTDNAAVTARANGVVGVTAQLTTESGRPIGRPVRIEVRVTQNGTTGWAIAVVAGAVLIGSTTLRIRQVTKERAREAAAAEAAVTEDDPGSPLGSVPALDLGPDHDDAPVGS